MKRALLLIILIAGIAYGAYALGEKKSEQSEIANVVKEGEVKEIPVEELETESDPEPVDEKAVLAAAIKSALIAKYGQDFASTEVSVSKINGDYANGFAGSTGGGGMWFGAKVGGEWKLVWDGNGTINCSDLEPYPDFPSSMIPECWDEATQQLIVR